MPGNIVWLFLITGIVANFFNPSGVMLIEQKFACFCLFMRPLGINRSKTLMFFAMGATG